MEIKHLTSPTEFKDSDLDTFTHALDLEKYFTDKYLSIVQHDLFLNNAVSYSQNLFQDKFLITLIGELHEKQWKCPKPNIDISDFVRNIVKKNPNTKVLIEYPNDMPSDVIKQIQSQAIRDTYTKLEADNNVHVIIPYDFRPIILGPTGNRDLYQMDFSRLSGRMYQANILHYIRTYFLDPYIFMQNRNPMVFSPNTSSPELSNLLQSEKTQLDYDFNEIVRLVNSENPPPPGQIQIRLKAFWQKVTDWFALREVFSDDQNANFIFIGGDKHFEFLKSQLQKITIQLDQSKISEENKCINLAGSFTYLPYQVQPRTW